MKRKYIIGIDEVGRAARRRASSKSYVIGIDEVGRGPLAGPVVVAVVAVSDTFLQQIRTLPKKLRDSKKLSEKDREWWVRHIKQTPSIFYAIARMYPRGIDVMNISRAANQAAKRAYERLCAQASLKKAPIFLDGGLYLGSAATQKKMKNVRTIVRGDEKIPAIALASIIAKVSRDQYMKRLAKRYPGYGFEEHKGYGTAQHLRALRAHGKTPAHRLTFLKKYPTIR